MRNGNITTEVLKNFYEKDNYVLLKNNRIFDNLIKLTQFWNDFENQDNDKFSEAVLRKLFILNYATNGMRKYFTSVYFMHNRDDEGLLEQEKFNEFL